MEKTELIQGNTTTIVFQSKNDDGTPLILDAKISIMILIYNSVEKVLFEGRCPGTIERIDATNYCVQLPHEITKNFQGKLTMEFAAYSEETVVVARNKIELQWIRNLSSKQLRK